MKTSSIPALAITFLFLLSLVAGCTPQVQPVTQPVDHGVTVTGTYQPTETFDPSQKVELQSFKSEKELQQFLQSSPNNYAGGGAMLREDTVATKAVGAPVPSMAPASDGAHSTTNNQVVGVDEGDIIKTDGKYIYTVTGNTLYIVSAGKDAKIIKTIEFKQAPSGIFIDGDKLAVFGNFYDLDYFKSIDFVPRNGMTFMNIYDVSDKNDPKLLKEYKFEGSYYESRMHDGHAYLVVTSNTDTRGSPMPYIIEGTAKRQMAVSDISYFPIPYDSIQLMSIHAINIEDLTEAVSSKAVAVQYGTNLYMSDKNIYLSSTEYINEWKIQQDITMELLEPQLTASDRTLIAKIKATDDDVLSQSEKEQKIYQVYSTYQNFMNSSDQQDLQNKVYDELDKRMAKYDATTYTIINRINIEGKVALEATGKVPGSVNDQFSMDEYNNVLRVATTIQPRYNYRPYLEKMAGDSIKQDPQNSVATNNVYTLDMDMNILGNMSNVAPDETIQSTRFIENRLYMVTYRQVDPFFVFDLSDPKNIKLLGKLKVPGFSRYLHPYDENTIIGIGRDATDTGRQQALKISLFDVKDVEHPKELAKWTASDDYAQSTAEWEHKAFLFDKDKQLLVIPAYSYNYDVQGVGKQQYNGAMVFKITPTEITMRGIIDHSQGQSTNYYSPAVERSLWIDDLLYTKSPSLIRVNQISDLKSVQNITLTSSTTGPYAVY